MRGRLIAVLALVAPTFGLFSEAPAATVSGQVVLQGMTNNSGATVALDNVLLAPAFGVWGMTVMLLLVTTGLLATGRKRSGTVLACAAFLSFTIAAYAAVISSATSDVSGAYVLRDVPPGTYLLTASYAGFQTANYQPVTVADINIMVPDLVLHDGTNPSPTSPTLVKDIYSGATGSSIEFLTYFNGKLYFRASDATNGGELWASDGRTTQTSLVKDIYPGIESSLPSQFSVLASKLFFAALHPTTGGEPWITDGTEAGTTLLKDILSGGSDSYPLNAAVIGSSVYFEAESDAIGREPWKTDGTTVDTTLVKDLSAGADFSSSGSFFTVNGLVFFTAVSGGQENLYITDGTPGGTGVFMDFNASGSDLPKPLATIGSVAYFRVSTAAEGAELWKTDGSPGGTSLVKDIRLGSAGSNPSYGAGFGGILYFDANDGTNGRELWRSDGTEAGTYLVKNIASGAENGLIFDFPPQFTVSGGKLFFIGFEASNGSELWKTDGTPAGTLLVKDILTGSQFPLPDPAPDSLTDVDGTLYFSAQDFANGRELWKSDGTEGGTTLVANIRSGSGNSDPDNLTYVNETLFFTANDGLNGAELWKYVIP